MTLRYIARCVMGVVLLCSRPAWAEVNAELARAVQFQDPAQIQALIAKGANPNLKENGRPLLGWAAQSGALDVVEALVKGGANVNLADDGVGHTPLMRAIDVHQVPVALYLLKNKANPNAKAPDGKSCLEMAVETRKIDLVTALIEAGADTRYVRPDGNSAALIAAQEGSKESVAIITLLAKAKGDLDSSDPAYTPLSYAAEQGSVEVVRALLEGGANPNKRTQSGDLPLLKGLDKKEIVELLLNAKADPNAANSSGTTPLFSAIEGGYTESAALLIKAGADTAITNESGVSALDYAEQYGRTEIAALLSGAKGATSGSSVRDNAEDEEDDIEGEALAAVSAAAGAKAAPRGSGTCSLTDAARQQMELHGLLQAEVSAGRMSPSIFSTFNEDTVEYGEMLVRDPSEACALFARLKKKYGVK